MMLSVISRRLIWPAHERLVGRATLRYLSELEWSQYASPVELDELRRRKLRALFIHAARHTAFYRDRIAEAGVDPERDDPFDALRALPPLDKDEIRARQADMLWHDAPGGLFPHNTGGSTGEPLSFFFDRRRQGYDQAARIRTHRWFGVDHGDRELFLWGSPIEWSRTDTVKRFRDALLNHRLLSAFDMSPARMDAYLDAIETYRPACLFGYPSSIALLVHHARSRGRRLCVPALRAVFVTGEVCHPPDREAIAEYLGVPVADGYGSREAGFIAHECPEGGMHVTAENVFVEVLRDGVPVPAGESGELVVTHLDAYAMPLVRYRTGDVGRLKPGRCACGRGLERMDVVDGRATDFIHLPDGTVKHALCAIYPLRALPGVQRFRVHQRSDYSVRVRVVLDPVDAGLTEGAVGRAMETALGCGLPIDVEFVADIPAVGSGKFRYVTSEVQPCVEGARSEETPCVA
jgi:phenylacetate-CoA ligase